MFIINAWNWLLDAASSWNLLAITIRLLFALAVGLIIGIVAAVIVVAVIVAVVIVKKKK